MDQISEQRITKLDLVFISHYLVFFITNDEISPTVYILLNILLSFAEQGPSSPFAIDSLNCIYRFQHYRYISALNFLIDNGMISRIASLLQFDDKLFLLAVLAIVRELFITENSNQITPPSGPFRKFPFLSEFYRFRSPLPPKPDPIAPFFPFQKFIDLLDSDDREIRLFSQEIIFYSMSSCPTISAGLLCQTPFISKIQIYCSNAPYSHSEHICSILLLALCQLDAQFITSLDWDQILNFIMNMLIGGSAPHLLRMFSLLFLRLKSFETTRDDVVKIFDLIGNSQLPQILNSFLEVQYVSPETYSTVLHLQSLLNCLPDQEVF